MKSITLFVSFSLILVTANTQEWTKVYYLEDWGIHSTTHISQIQFINPRVGYFSTYSTGMGSAGNLAYIYRTTDFGRNWEKIHTVGSSSPGSSGFMEFDFIDERNFFLFESSDAIYHGLLFNDSIASRYCFTPYRSYIKMISADTIVLTHFEDQNYIFMLTPGNGKLRKLQIADDYVFSYPYWLECDIIDEVFFIKGFGAATGNRNGLNFFYSTNSPAFESWKKDTLNISGKINKLHFKNKNIGFIVCNDTLLYRTQDSGLSWDGIALPEKMKINGIEFSDTKGYIISTNGRVAISIDDGVTWVVKTLDGAGSLSSLATVNDFVYVVDENRQIFTNNTLLPVIPIHVQKEFLELYPNPVNSEINVRSILNIQNCSVYNNLGILIRKLDQINSASFSFNIGEFSPGVYFLKFDFDDGFMTKKIIKD
jgi:hypothetical protein